MERYRLPDGSFSAKKSAAIRISASEVQKLGEHATDKVPSGYFVATAARETGNAVNEQDTETSGFVSKGLYQIADSEAIEVGMPGADLFDPEVATFVMARLAERNLSACVAAGGMKLPDIWAYLGIAHNEGVAAAKKTIRLHGLDWSRYKTRNFSAALARLAENPADPSAQKELDRVGRISRYGDAILEAIG